MAIKNIVFDVGDVLVRYDPAHIVSIAFPEHEDPSGLLEGIFKNKTWYDLNLGHISEAQAIEEYHAHLGLEIAALQNMAQVVKDSLSPILGSIALLKQLYAKYSLYALTDNTQEIMAYLQKRYDFWPLFKGIVVSATVGMLKPSKEIFHYLLESYNLIPDETVFIDDLAQNVAGAQAVGIHAIQFINPEQCIDALKALKVSI